MATPLRCKYFILDTRLSTWGTGQGLRCGAKRLSLQEATLRWCWSSAINNYHKTIDIQQRKKKFSIPNHNARNPAFKKPMTIVSSFTNELPVTSSLEIKGETETSGKISLSQETWVQEGHWEGEYIWCRRLRSSNLRPEKLKSSQGMASAFILMGYLFTRVGAEHGHWNHRLTYIHA